MNQKRQASTVGRVTEYAIPRLLKEMGSPWGSQVEMEITQAEVQASRRGWGGRCDFFVRVRWQGIEFEFAAEAKARNTPRVLEDALRASRRWASETGRLPMVIVPFLGERRVDRLQEEGVSGLDLCGNGLLVVPGRLLLRRTGQPNRYPESRPARFAYRGSTSLVPRVFLRRPSFRSVGDIKTEIDAAGGSVGLSTVSKALARMTEDLVIDRTADGIELLQPDRLFELLAESFRMPRPERVKRVKLNAPLATVFARSTMNEQRPSLVLSGASSMNRYAAGMRGDNPVLYCQWLDELTARIGDAWVPTERYSDATICETRDPTPFFDTRRDAESAIVYTSPVQTYLELMADGEKRDREIAGQVREIIMRDLQK